MRLDKYLADMRLGTRSQVRDIIKKGRVTLNGEVTKDAGAKVGTDDVVTCDGSRIGYVETEYYMLYKPQGTVSATEDKRYPTVTSLIPSARKDLFPVGRLDLDTEGLLIITNDGQLTHRLLAPNHHVDKVYYLETDNVIPERAIAEMAKGVVLEGEGRMQPADLEILSETAANLTIREGKFHQVKRMMELYDCTVTYLKRLSMGPLELDPELEPGDWRPLSEEEISVLKAL